MKPEAATGIAGALRGRRFEWAAGAAILAAVVVWVEWTVGWGRTLAPWRTLEASALAAALGLLAASYLTRAARLKSYFPHLSWWPTLRLSLQHNAANNLLPMRLGEAVFPILMQRYFGARFGSSVLSLLWIRLLDLHTLLLVGSFALWRIGGSPFWAVTCLGVAAVLPVGALSFGALTRRAGAAPGSRFNRIVGGLGAALPADPRRWVAVYLLTVLTWFTKLLAFVTVLEHFADVERWPALVGAAAGELSSVLPVHGIAGSGSYELAMVGALAMVGVTARDALAGAVNVHLLVLGVSVALAAAGRLLPRPARPR